MNPVVPATGQASSAGHGLSMRCAAPPHQPEEPGPSQPWRNRQRQHWLERTVKKHHVSIRSSLLEPAGPSQNSLFNLLGPFFPLLTIKANIKTFISPLEPTSPETSTLWQIQDALVCLYGFKAVREVAWLSRIRKSSHKGFFNPFY